MKLVEKMAREMCAQAEREALRHEFEVPAWRLLSFPSLEAWIEDRWPNYCGQAIATLKAMREPTLEQLSAGMEEATSAIYADDVESIWQAMIDQAIKEGE